MSIRFGTGGWRDIIGDGFTRRNVELLAAALAQAAKESPAGGRGVVVGYDRRFLSREAAQWAAQVLAAEGVPCLFIDRASPTPLMMFSVDYFDLSYGIAVTASHNPAIYNGIKVFTRGGRDADVSITDDLETRIGRLEGTDIPRVEFDDGVRSGLIRMVEPMNAYIDAIIRSINMDAIRSRSLHVALDPMYGVSKTALQTILVTARCDVDVIHERHDALFGGRLPAPNVHTLGSLRAFVEEHHCDIGIATDGDADRLGVIDDTGEFLHPNKILVLLYYYLLKYRGWHGAAVRNIATTHLLDAIAAGFGEQCHEVPVGFKHISAKMAETGAVIGGESSGGLTVRGHIHGKDGIYAGSLLVEMIAVTGKKLSQLYAEIEEQYGKFETVERDYRFSAAKKERINRLLFEERALPELSESIESADYTDGCKLRFVGGGWLICRFSGTEPLLRIFCETDGEKRSAAIIDEMQSFLRLSPGADM